MRFCCLLTVLLSCFTSLIDAADTPPTRILFVTQSKGYVHRSVRRNQTSLAPAEIALVQLGQQTGLFDVDCTQECEHDFTRENLQNYDIVAFYTSGDLPIAKKDLDYFFQDWLKQPKHGVLGFHSATDTYKNYAPYYEMIGGSFIKHPWTSGTTVTLTNHEPCHPCVKPFGEQFVIKDEIYMYKNFNPNNVRVLLSLDYSKSPAPQSINVEYGYHVPVCWVRRWGQGKIYVNNLGHNASSWTNQTYLNSIANAVRWIRGELDGPAAPNPKLSAAQEQKARQDAEEYGFKIDLPKLAKVTGRVTLNGQPLAKAVVRFRSNGKAPTQGVTDASGRFEIFWDPKTPGAIVGKNRVDIRIDHQGKSSADDTEVFTSGTPITVDVKEGQNDFRFDLSNSQ